MIRCRLGGMVPRRRDGSVLARGDMISEDRELVLGGLSAAEKAALPQWSTGNEKPIVPPALRSFHPLSDERHLRKPFAWCAPTSTASRISARSV
jgi:hypothetical protein